MALADPVRTNTQAEGASLAFLTSNKSQWQTVHNNAETTTTAPTTISNLTTSVAFWTKVGAGITRISALRQEFTGTLATNGATVTVIGVDKWDDGANTPASDAAYRTIASGIALGNTTDITNGTTLNTTPQTNSGAGWDLLGDAAFIVAVTTAASNPTTCIIEAKLT